MLFPIEAKAKVFFASYFQDNMIALALNKFGSRVIDTVWGWASIKQKEMVASSLCQRIAQLNANQYGKFIAEKCALRVYKSDPTQWAQNFEQSGKRKKGAEDLAAELGLDEDETPVKKSKKSKKSKKDRDANQTLEDSVGTETEETLVEMEEEADIPEDEEPKKKKKKKDKKSKKEREEEDE
jgi:hypothetical protein